MSSRTYYLTADIKFIYNQKVKADTKDDLPYESRWEERLWIL